MKIDAWIGLPEASSSHELASIGARAAVMEQEGYSGLLAAETSHDPFLPLALAAEHTERIELMTGIAVGFARNPMVLAHVAWDLQALSGGRFLLGLGSQIQARITERFGGTLDRLQFYAGVTDAELWAPIIDEIKAA